MSILIYGIASSAILALWTIGFSLTFGISGLANFCYGALYILGAFICWGLIVPLGLPLFLAAVITIVIIGFFGFALYWGLLLRVRGLALSEIVTTFAAGVAILEFLRWKGYYGYKYSLPVFIDGSVEIGGVFIDYQRLFIIGIGLALIFFLYLFIHHTRTGLSFRGIAQNERTAISLGIESDWTAALSLALGSALAVVAAIITISVGLININQGYDVLIWVIAVGILGGLESIPGIIAASFILGFLQTATATYFNPKWMAVVPVAAIILILAVKPSGIFGSFKELEERV